MPRILLVLLVAASLSLIGCGGHYHGPEIAYEGVFNTSSDLGGDKQVTLRLYDNGAYMTRTIYNGQSFVPVVEAGTWELIGDDLVLHTERIDGEPTPNAATVFSVNADDLEAVSINGSPLDYVWAYADGTKLSEQALEAPSEDHGDGDGDDEGADHDSEGGYGDEDHGDDAQGDDAVPTDAVEDDAAASNA